jgi:hypothetical protein
VQRGRGKKRFRFVHYIIQRVGYLVNAYVKGHKIEKSTLLLKIGTAKMGPKTDYKVKSPFLRVRTPSIN